MLGAAVFFWGIPWPAVALSIVESDEELLMERRHFCASAYLIP